jgi:hypothetical protein
VYSSADAAPPAGVSPLPPTCSQFSRASVKLRLQRGWWAGIAEHAGGSRVVVELRGDPGAAQKSG